MSLQQKAYRSAGWSGIGGLISNGLELLKYIVLARILTPGDFGLLAMAMVVISLGRIFADGGTSNAVIHFRSQSSRQLSTLYWINISAAAGLYLVIYVTAPFFAVFYGEPEVGRLLRIGGAILPLFALGTLYEVLLRKKLSFKYITVSESISSLAGFITATVLALWGFGVYSLIWSHIITAGTMSLMYMGNGMRTWRPSFCFSPGEVRSHLSFGLFQMGERGLSVYSARIDQLIIGRFFGAEILGAYHLAYHLVLFPITRLSPLLNRVAFPVFSSRQDDNAVLRNGYLKLMRAIMALTSPFFLLAALTAPWLVPLLFGGGWELAAALIPLMAAIGLLRMVGNPSGNIVLAKGRARLVFFWNLGTAIINTLVFLAGAQYSVFVLLWMYLAANALYFAVGQSIMVNNLIGLSWPRFFGGIASVAGILAISWAASLAGRWFIVSEGLMLSDVVMVAVIALLFAMVYFPLVWWTQSGFIREFLDAVKNRPR
ncbi:MAG: colanic acid exporter [Balneolaceae bacterium]|nr:MAG: colanic acid exporter [Balneolaceae bacterium]